MYEVYTNEKGQCNFGGWFFLTGQILEPGERRVEQDGLSYHFSDGHKFPRPDGEFGLDLLALDFTTAAKLF